MRHNLFSMLPDRAFQRVGKKILSLEGGSSPAPPDYSATAAASKYAADKGFELGTAQMDMAQRLYDSNRADMAPILGLQRSGMEQQNMQGREMYDNYKNTYQPIERQMATDAVNFNTGAYKDQLASTAAADYSLAENNQEQQQLRSMASMGIDPSTGRGRAMTGMQRVQNAANRAGAATGARMQADQLGWARRSDVASMGRGLPGGATSALSTASSMGNSYGANTMGMGNTYTAGMNTGIGTQMAGLNTQMQGLNSINGMRASQYSTDAAHANDGMTNAIGGLAAGATVYATYAA